MSQTIIDLLNKGTHANLEDNFRQGNVIYLPADGSLIITGDLHGHRRNFERSVSFADLANNPDRHIILQEVIHGGPEDSYGGCLSYQLLLDIVRYKLNFPEQVHIIMGNHDTAFINDKEIMKDGREMNRAMSSALKREYKETGDEIIAAMKKFLFSQALAVKCENRIWASHSLPADRFFDKFDPQVLDRDLTKDDIIKPGSAYLITWGRRMSQELLDKMAELLDIDIFVLGQENGWRQEGKNLLIIASNHNHGYILSVDLSKTYTIEQLIDCIVPLSSIH